MYATRYQSRLVLAPTLAALFAALRNLAKSTAFVAVFIALDACGQIISGGM